MGTSTKGLPEARTESTHMAHHHDDRNRSASSSRIAITGIALSLCLPALAQIDSTKITLEQAGTLNTMKAEAEAKGWTFTVGDTEAFRQELWKINGVEGAENWRKDAAFDDAPPRGTPLPTTFDWRNVGGVNYMTDVRSQGGCGSCWSFALYGSLESNILIKDGLNRDLSEQWLVSCCGLGGCGGQWPGFAANYLQRDGLYVDECGGFGAVVEQDFPYLASDDFCGCPYEHPYTIESWSFIGPEWGTPTDDQLKQAILDHGPITVCITTNGAFSAYTGGVFNAHDPDPITHAVVLVGWDDAQGTEGVWFMRNSWGDWWGEDGYMRIEYGCSNIGYNALYLDYDGSGDEDGTLNVPGEYATIQQAIDAANPGQQVLVAAGRYSGEGSAVIDLAGKAITLRSSAGAEATILDGEHARPVIELLSSEGSSTVIDGFTITQGYSALGGGLRVDGTPTIRNCIIRDNNAQSAGGGLACSDPTGPTLENVRFCGNMVGTTLGAHCFGSWVDGGAVDLDDWCTCAGDTNDDGATDVADLLAVISAWATDEASADFNFDGTVGVDDLLTVISNWGTCS